MAKRRRYTPEFKAEVVLEALSGESSQAELCRRHNLKNKALEVEAASRKMWHLCLPPRIKQSSEATERIAQLEQLVGRLTLALEIQKKASTLLD